MIKIADFSDLNEIVNLRVYQQIEDWNNTNPKKGYSVYAKSFYRVTKDYLSQRLNKDIVFALMYTDGKAVSLCGLQVKESLPQITVCQNGSEKSAELVSVYTVPDCRGRGYMQSLLLFLLDFAKEQGYTDVVLSTNTDDAKHIYEKFGFKYISDKYYLRLADNAERRNK